MSMNELVKLKKPSLPVFWDYETSVKFVSETIFKWKNLTEDIAKELWIAREKLRSPGARNDLTSGQKSRGWAQKKGVTGTKVPVIKPGLNTVKQ